MRLGYFQRVDPTPFKVRLELTGPVTIVNQHDVIYVDYDTYKDVIGFKFVGWTTDVVNPSDKPRVNTLYQGDTLQINDIKFGGEVPPHKKFMDKMKAEDATKVSYREYDQETLNKLTEESPKTQNKKIDEIVADIEAGKATKEELIEALRLYDRTKWFAAKKDVVKKYMDVLGVDYSLIPDSRHNLITHLKTYIKSLTFSKMEENQ